MSGPSTWHKILHCRLQDIRGLSSPGGQAGIHREAWHSGKNGFTLISVGCTRALRPYYFCSCDHVGQLADALSQGRISTCQISATTKIPLHVSPSFCSFNPRSALFLIRLRNRKPCTGKACNNFFLIVSSAATQATMFHRISCTVDISMVQNFPGYHP